VTRISSTYFWVILTDAGDFSGVIAEGFGSRARSSPDGRRDGIMMNSHGTQVVRIEKIN
jgi:hypothetical protein